MEPLPVDRGWAWVICSTVFLIGFVAITGSQVNAIGFLDMVKELNTTVTTMSISVTVQFLSSSIFALISVNVLVPRFGERPVVICGSVLAVATSLGMSFAPSISVFIVFGVFKGAALGTYFVCCVALIGFYFKKRRAIATTIGMAGTCVGAIGPPRLIRLCVDEYGIRGTYFLFAAFELHLIAFAMLLRPVKSYGPPVLDELTEEPEEEPEHGCNGYYKEEKEMKLLEAASGEKRSQSETDGKEKPNLSFKRSDAETNPEENATEGLLDKDDGAKMLADDKRHSHEDVDAVPPGSPGNDGTGHRNGHNTNSKSPVSSRSFRNTGHDNAVSLNKSPMERQDSTWSSTGSVRRPRLERGQSVWSMMSIQGQTTFESTLSLSSLTSGSADAASHPVGQAGQDKGKTSVLSMLRNAFNLSVFREWRFCCLIFGDLLASSNHYLFAYFPTLVVIQGVSKDQAATLQTILGSVDLAGRIAAGFVGDSQCVRPSQVPAVSMVFLGVMSHLYPLFTTFQSMIPMTIGLGLFIGVHQSLSPVVYTEVMGLQRMSKSYSISILMVAGGAAAHSAFLSAILESEGTTNIVWHYIGVVLLINSVILWSLPMVHRLELKYKAKPRHKNRTSLAVQPSVDVMNLKQV